MASLSINPKNRLKRIMFVDPLDRKRKTIYLGDIAKKAAEEVLRRVESILSYRASKMDLPAELASWTTEISDDLHEKLARLELVPVRAKAQKTGLGSFLDAYVERRIDVKPATKEVWNNTVRNLKEHFGEETNIVGIDAAGAEDFKLYLIGLKLAPTTVSKRLQFARQFFKDAKKRKLFEQNPFEEISSVAGATKDRMSFISREATQKILEHCNPNWRLIVALARYGGLRSPSEVLSLRWEDVNLAEGRMTVISPKTEHHEGKATRLVPIFPELRPFLEDAFELAEDGAEHVVGGGYRQAAMSPVGWRNCNLRTQFERLIRRAGLKPWSRLFHSLRSSRETELVREHPIHVVTEWLGNSPKIAMKHYLKVTDQDFDKAIGGNAESNAVTTQNFGSFTTLRMPFSGLMYTRTLAAA